MSLEEEAEIFQMQAEGFEKLQVEGGIDVSGMYKVARDRVYEPKVCLIIGRWYRLRPCRRGVLQA